MSSSPFSATLSELGFAIIPRVFSADECAVLGSEISAALQARTDDAEAIRARSGVVYAGRNLLDVLPSSKTIWRRPALLDLLFVTLGNNGGLVRALFFDKPPEQTWSLPWHKDFTIAVRDNRAPSVHFTKPTVKAGVPHVEAPLEVLQTMLTLRIHLDDMTEENGPLYVLPGSHHTKEDATNLAAAEPIHLCGGDVFAMRPLLTHSSTSSRPGTTLHRRILHLEFAAHENLPDGYQWHNFVPLTTIDYTDVR